MKLTEKHHFLSLMFILSNFWPAALSVEVLKHKSKPSPDLTADSSIVANSFKAQSLSPPSAKYGYPYAVAPTLTPIIHARSDELENEAIVSKPKPYGSKFPLSEDPLKKNSLKKHKAPFSHEAARRQSFDGSEGIIEKRFKAYKEPKYRNFDELESRFRPRRIDYAEPYDGYNYVPSRRPPSSPRDPYLSPPNAPVDMFYPTVPKVKSYSAPYVHSGPKSPGYGAGGYEEPVYHENLPYNSYGSYGPSYYPTSEGQYNYQEDYEIESNQPITGDIRKRLLDYAGASDLYEGEPDYLQRFARNKNKYGQVANDYYAYGGPGYRSSYRDFPYVESKISLLKKQRS